MVRSIATATSAPSTEWDVAAATLDSYFDKVLVLTLDRAKERQERVRRVLAGLDFEFFTGVDKSHLDLDQLVAEGVYDPRRARRLHRHGKEMRLGEIACAMSHLAMYRRIVEAGWRRVLIFEDDVEPIPERLPLLPSALEQLPPTFELAYLGYDKHERVTPRQRWNQAAYRVLSVLRLIKWTPREVSNLLPRGVARHVQRAGWHDCTHAYAITPAGARKMLEAQRPIALAADLALTRALMRGDLEAYSVVPVLFDQDGGVGRARAGGSYVRDRPPRAVHAIDT
jgi:glycosyl transferase family 25